MHVVVAWCELRLDFRHFRTDRMVTVMQLETPYLKSRRMLLKKWRDLYNIPEQ